MGNSRKSSVGTALFLVLFLSLSLLFFYMSVTVSREIPDTMEYRRSRLSDGINFETYEKIPQGTYTKDLSVCAELDAVYVDGIGEVKPVLINENFFDIYNIFVSGSKISKGYVENRTPAIIISDKAAMRLSLDGNVIGKEISLFGKTFTIVGKYQMPDGFLREISSDTFERVYIPYSCYDGYAKMSVDALAAKKGTASEKALSLVGLSDTDANFYLQNDLGMKREVVANFPRLFIFGFSLVLAVFSLKQIAALSKETYQKLKQECEEDDLLPVIKNNRRLLLSRLAAVFFLTAVPVALIILFPSKIVLPQKAVPYDNLFEWKHYLDVFTKERQTLNACLQISNSYFDSLFQSSLSVLTPGVIFLWLFVIRVFRRIPEIRMRFRNRAD